MEN
ncbi:tRNA pseudouridine synthase A, partial [Yersinia pestis PY-34]|jgi:aryl-alcohol dehydrogenase-like predicted oxidoreductase